MRFSLLFLIALGGSAGLGLGACNDTLVAPLPDDAQGGAGGSGGSMPGGVSGEAGVSGSGQDGGASSGGEVGLPGDAGSGGSRELVSGGRAATTGGRASTANGGTSTGGTNTAGASGGVEPIGSGGEAQAGQGGATAEGSALVFCSRLARPVDLTDLVRRDYLRAVVSDCDVAGMIRNRPSDELVNFSNAVATWNFRFWGCSTPTVETTFGLTYRADALTGADARRLVELYMTVVTGDLELSPAEVSSVLTELERLARAAVVNPAEDVFSMSTCGPVTGGGGAGGAGGASDVGGSDAGGTTGGESTTFGGSSGSGADSSGS
jgi:hypothetical protein